MDKKKTLLTVIILFFSIAYAEKMAHSLDAPHNTVFQLDCYECHVGPPGTYTAAWSLEAPTEDGYYYRTEYQCLFCHEPTSGSPMPPRYKTIKTHSSYETSSKYGYWSYGCTTCHAPHGQEHFRTYKNEAGVEYGISTAMTYTSMTDATPGKFSGKDYTDYILVPNVKYVNFNYRIVGNDDNTIRVEGTMNVNYAPKGSNYAIFYGKLITSSLYSSIFKFFSNTGQHSFADDDSVIDGICQVCHNYTNSFNTGGVLEGPGHPPATAGTNCMTCHPHSQGFRAVAQ